MFGVVPDDLRPYPARWQRPRAQLAARVALWSAVVIGCSTGLIALARPAPGPAATPTADAGGDLPAPVAGTAERAVAAWLNATGEDGGDPLSELFVEPVRGLQDASPLEVGDVATVAGRTVGPGYWWVTVAADVTETAPAPTAEDQSDSDEAASDEPVTTTWYIQVAVVGDVESRLAVLTTPQVVPVAPALPGEWSRVEESTIEEGTGLYDTIDGFLRALLTGDGDPAVYMTPGWSIELPADPMFAGLEITAMGSEATSGDGPLRVRVEVTVNTAAGNRREVAYTVEVTERDGRWEVVDLPGGPTVERREGGTGGGPATTTSSSPPPSTEGGGTVGEDDTPPDEWVPDGDESPPGSDTAPVDPDVPPSGATGAAG